MQRLFTNTEEKSRDRINSFINLEAGNSKLIRIATAYFTHDGLSKSFFDNAEVRLLVGMSGVISTKNLRLMLGRDNVTVRYYFDKFHPKIYLFSTGTVILGSSNYTPPGIGLADKSNRECNVASDEKLLFEEVGTYFDELWASAAELREDQLDQVELIQQKLRQQQKETDDILGQLRPVLDYELYTSDKSTEVFATYAKFIYDFRDLSDKYFDTLGRLTEMPDRIEIDQFLSWIFSAYKEDSAGVILNKEERSINIKKYLDLFRAEYDRTKFYDHARNNPILTESLLSRQNIQNLDESGIAVIAHSINSFDDRTVDAFIKDNGVNKIRGSFEYLLFGEEDIKIRLTQVLQGRYKIKYFQSSRALELLGWADNDYPIWNLRVALAMSILGYNNFRRDKSAGINDRASNK